MEVFDSMGAPPSLREFIEAGVGIVSALDEFRKSGGVINWPIQHSRLAMMQDAKSRTSDLASGHCIEVRVAYEELAALIPVKWEAGSDLSRFVSGAPFVSAVERLQGAFAKEESARA